LAISILLNIMTMRHEPKRVFRCGQGGDAQMWSRAASSEVQIDGIPKQGLSEVASTT